MIALDTSFLIDSRTGPKRWAGRLRSLLENGERIMFSALVLYEWQRGERFREEIALQEALLPAEEAIAFGYEEAQLTAQLYRHLRARGREIDLAIAATAILRDAELLTLNPADFADVPGLRLAEG